MKLSNRVAIVTASTKGIGLECAKLLAQNGAIVYLAARNQVLAEKIIKEHQQNNLCLKFVYFDAKDKESIEKMVDIVYAQEGRIDILVNNYGGANPSKDLSIFETLYEDYIKIIEENLRSVFITSQKVMNIMKNQQIAGSIINISSIGSVINDVSRIGYCNSKAAINNLTQNAAMHAGRYNIRCNAILPGYVETDATKDNLPKEFLEMFMSQTPIRRPAYPIDIANAVLFLASDESQYITAQLLEISGGFGKASPLYAFFNK